MRFVRVDRALLRKLLTRCIEDEKFREVAQLVNRSCVFDRECVDLERRNEIVYRSVLDE